MPHKTTNTAQLQCDKGSKPSELKVTSHDFSYFEDKPNENILPFGNCKLKNNQTCKPETEKWDKTTAKDTINDLKIVVETSECLCKTGGKITITNKGHFGKSEAE